MNYDDIQLNVSLLRQRVPNLTNAARAAGLRAATVSNLCTGKIPVGRAEVKTLVTLASLANCSLDDLIIIRSNISVIETGVKILDLLAPVVRGGTIGFVAGPGMGQLVMLTELFLRMQRRGYTTIFWKPQIEAEGISDLVTNSDVTCTNLSDIYKQIAAIPNDCEIFLGADRETVLSGELLTLREQLEEGYPRCITIALVDTSFEAVDEHVPYGPLDTLLRFDADLLSRGLFPAIDPIFSISTALEGAHLEATHWAIQQRARKLLRRYRELRALVRVHGFEKLADPDKLIYRRGERLEAFLTQPFYVAEPYTQKNGEWLPLQDTLDSVRRILDGAADDLEVVDLTNIGHFYFE